MPALVTLLVLAGAGYAAWRQGWISFAGPGRSDVEAPSPLAAAAAPGSPSLEPGPRGEVLPAGARRFVGRFRVASADSDPGWTELELRGDGTAVRTTDDAGQRVKGVWRLAAPGARVTFDSGSADGSGAGIWTWRPTRRSWERIGS